MLWEQSGKQHGRQHASLYDTYLPMALRQHCMSYNHLGNVSITRGHFWEALADQSHHDGYRCPGAKYAPGHQQPLCWLACVWIILRNMHIAAQQTTTERWEGQQTRWFLCYERVRILKVKTFYVIKTGQMFLFMYMKEKITVFIADSGIILCMRLVNERRRYNVTSSLIGWAHAQNNLCRIFVRLIGDSSPQCSQ